MGFESFADNLDVRQHLEGLGYVREGVVITPEDYKAIESRAQVLMREARERGSELSEEDAVPMAYFDRMMVQGQIGIDDVIDTVEQEELRGLLSGYSGNEYTEEQSEAFARFMRGQAERPGVVLTDLINEWIEERAAATQDIPDVAVADAKDTVQGIGNDPRELMREAREE